MLNPFEKKQCHEIPTPIPPNCYATANNTSVISTNFIILQDVGNILLHST